MDLNPTLEEQSTAQRPQNKRDQQKARTRLAILQAGRQVFATRGFDAPNVADLARAAGVSRATFYLHFQSREELMLAVFQREVLWQMRKYRDLTSDVVANERRFRGWAERLISGFRAERQYVLIIYRALSLDPANIALIAQAHERLIQRFARRVPQFRLMDEHGQLDRTRAIELSMLMNRLEDISARAAFDSSWTDDFELALAIIVRQFMAFIHG